MRKYSENLYGTLLGADIYVFGSVHILVGSKPLELLKFHVLLSSLTFMAFVVRNQAIWKFECRKSQILL